MGGAFITALTQHGYDDIVICTKTKPVDLHDCEVVFLAVKPYVFPEITLNLKPETHLVSLMWGVSYEGIKSRFPENPLTLIMPNLAMAQNLGVTGIYSPEPIPEQIEKLFSAGALPVHLNSEVELLELTKLSGSGPGYLAMISKWITDSVNLDSLSEAEKKALWQRTLQGSAQLMESHNSFESLYNAVASPQGLTENIVKKLQDAKVPQSLAQIFENN